MFVHKVVLENTVKFISHAAHCKLFIKKFSLGEKDAPIFVLGLHLFLEAYISPRA